MPARSPRDILESLSIGVQQELFPAAETKPPAAEPPQPHATRLAEAAGRKPPAGLGGRVLEALIPERGRTVEEVSARTEVAVEEVLGALLELELAGWARRAPGPVYLRTL